MQLNNICQHMNTHCRWLFSHDLPGVEEIERACSDITEPWSTKEWEETLQPYECMGKAVFVDGQIAGVMAYRIHATHANLLRIAVRPNLHLRKLGTILINQLKRTLKQESRNRIFVEIPEENLTAQVFFRANGFKWIRTVIEGPQLSYVMRYELEDA